MPGAEQPDLTVVASPDRGDGARMSWVQMADTPGGLAVKFNDFQHSTPRFRADHRGQRPFDRTQVPHTIRSRCSSWMPANDVVRYLCDGTLKHTGTSWEDYFRDSEAQPDRTVDSILFRTAGTAAPLPRPARAS